MNKQRSQAALSRVIVTFLKSMVGSYILYTPKVPLRAVKVAAMLFTAVAPRRFCLIKRYIYSVWGFCGCAPYFCCCCFSSVKCWCFVAALLIPVFCCFCALFAV